MNLIRYTPNRWMDTMFDRVFGEWPGAAVEPTEAAPSTWAPRVDIREQEKAIEITAELPGVDRNGLKVEVAKGVLTLSGEKSTEREVKDADFYRRERVYGKFERSFTLPDEIDAERIEAEYRDGVLRVVLPKKPEVTPKQIAVKNGNGDAKKIGVN